MSFIFIQFIKTFISNWFLVDGCLDECWSKLWSKLWWVVIKTRSKSAKMRGKRRRLHILCHPLRLEWKLMEQVSTNITKVDPVQLVLHIYLPQTNIFWFPKNKIFLFWSWTWGSYWNLSRIVSPLNFSSDFTVKHIFAFFGVGHGEDIEIRRIVLSGWSIYWGINESLLSWELFSKAQIESSQELHCSAGRIGTYTHHNLSFWSWWWWNVVLLRRSNLIEESRYWGMN